MLTYDELRESVSIDPAQLDKACADQPTLFMEVSDLASDAKAKAKSAKYAWERTQAVIIIDYRTGKIPTDVKLTETSLISLAIMHEKVTEAKEAQIVAEKYASKCDGLIGAYDHRRSMLSNEVSLYTTNYFHNCDVKPRSTQSTLKKITHEESEKLQEEIVSKRSSDGVRRRS